MKPLPEGPQTPEEDRAIALLVLALQGRGTEGITEPGVLIEAFARLISAANMLAETLADHDHAAAVKLTPDERDRWSLYGSLLLAFEDVVEGHGDDEQHLTMARATEHLTTAREWIEDFAPNSPRARRYRRERESE